MANVVADLIVRLGAQTGRFDRGMNRSRGIVGRFRGAVSDMGMGLMRFGATAAGEPSDPQKQLVKHGEKTVRLLDMMGRDIHRMAEQELHEIPLA